MELRVLALTFIAVSLISLSWGIELIEPERLYWTNEDEFISSVVLNKEGVTYDLLLLEALNVNKTVIDFDEYFIYQSHYRSDIAVIISNNTAPYRGSLNIRVMPKLKVDSTVYLNIFLPEKRDFKKPALSYSFDEWETIVNYPYGANYTNNAELIITRLDERVIISITNPLSEMVTKTSVSILYELNPNESLTTQDRDSIYLIINEVLNLTGSEVNSLTALINSMPSDETITDEQLITVNAYSDNDAKQAVKTELEWLLAEGVIKGLTSDDLNQITALTEAGSTGNYKVVFNEDWVVHARLNETEGFRGSIDSRDFNFNDLDLPVDEVIKIDTYLVIIVCAVALTLIIILLKNRISP